MIAAVVAPLRRHPEHLEFFARCFEQEWPSWYGQGSRSNALDDLRAFANPAGTLPVGVVALDEGGAPLGVAALKATSIAGYEHLTPWAAAGYVRPELRRQGIGAKLLSGVLGEASRLGFESVYCATSTAASLLLRQGFQLLEETLHDGAPISLWIARTTPPGTNLAAPGFEGRFSSLPRHTRRNS